ncbi:SDR family NAD(P)-dependent oxidoreductase [Actinosynnema sp. NPDC023658]|uniref:SDR family NAD(P)-dependent oxidoreductase n=1 Tax=Actinosynnema sp. NPDC023658 TaxID=3155465 RepID=UPI0033D83091
MTRTALVTGANQGIGFALVAELADRLGPDDLVLLTGRDPERVATAAKSVHGTARVEGRVLDVTDADAIAALAAELGRTDIVISNAVGPLTPGVPPAEQVDEFAAVANGGTHAVLRSFGPTLPAGGRLLVVASSLGSRGHLPAHLRPLLDGVTLDEVEAVVEQWREAVHDGTAAAKGWPEWIYVPSKVAQVAAVRAVAEERRPRDLADGTLVASVCPGLVDTRASRPWFTDFSRAQTPAQAARPIVDLALAPLDPSTYGELVRFGAVLPWHSGGPVD